MYCCSAQENKMDYKRRFLLGGSKQKVQQHQYPMPELGRTMSAPLTSPAATSSLPPTAPSSCPSPTSPTTQIADIQQGISKYLDALNVFCRASTLLTDLFSSVFRNSHYSKAAMQLKDVQVHVMEAASRLTAAIKPEIAKMLMELSAGTANFKDQNDFSLQDIEVLGRCFLTVLQVHFQFLSQALHRVQPLAHSCLAEAQAQERKNAMGTEPAKGSRVTELEEAVRSWAGASEATSRLRERGSDGCLAGIEVQRLICTQTTAIPEHQLKDLNMKIDSALQAYKVALESLGHCEYAMKAGFHLNPKAIEASLQGCCSEAEVKQAGRRQYPAQPLQCELPTVPVQIGPHFLKGVSFSESGAENLKLKMQAMVQLIKEASGQSDVSPRDEPPTEILNQVCPSTWRGACKTAVQLLFGQAGLVVVDTAQIENKEAYAPQISLEGTRVVVQVPSTWCVKEDPATMSLLQRCLDPEKTLGLIDVLYTAVFDLSKWKERREQVLPSIQIQLRRECAEFGSPVELPVGNGSMAKPSAGLQRTFAKLTSRFTKRGSCSGGGNGAGSFSIPSNPSKSGFSLMGTEEERRAKPPHADQRLQSILNVGHFPKAADGQDPSRGHGNPLVNGFSLDQREALLKGEEGIKLPSDQEMQDVIDFLSGFTMGKSQQASPQVSRKSPAGVLDQKGGVLQQGPPAPHGPMPPSQPVRQHPQKPPPYYQHLLQPIGQPAPTPSLPHASRAPGKWPNSSPQQRAQSPGPGLSPIGPLSQWNSPGPPSDLGSDLYSLGLVGNYMDSIIDNVMSDMLAPKAPNTRNNTWPNRMQSDGVFGMLADVLPFDPAVGSDPEFARYVAGVSQAMQQKRQAQQMRRHSTARTNWPVSDEAHRTWHPPEYFTEGDVMSWSGTQGDSASSSDEASSANGDSLFSMFSGPDLVAAVKQRRKHSSGDRETSTLPSPPVLSTLDDLSQDNKTKTWPPKAPWQHLASHSNTMPNPGTSLYQMTSPPGQWNDSVQMLPSTVWSTVADGSSSSGISSNFSYGQQPPQCQPPVSQHKPVSKGFKSYPLKQERRPSYLHQY
ncbi:granule associated Rac and RHOG effector protein 1-like [Leucoraja erinacea]|uniref:granule associated Rac and RHOG effector protein 1-like n=1 Tax=Leucoraja erinaceus TaxID=7782 RepID=UPI0024567BAF|nr:granule associated Rac and RHOG effector protein 1-like [Leucoraja erinacea]XP_055504774.1 granule associated Rac and RHOG effector protein 1-like [Leucoraja erinacea]XP_055504775.1 granule associated Rac and RHOG effector protein 1-like [Leucoraja erinacea]